MSRTTFLILVLFFFFFRINAQVSQDYIVLTNNDTLYGKVKTSKFQLELSEKIEFTNANGKGKKYKLPKIKAVFKGGSLFRTISINHTGLTFKEKEVLLANLIKSGSINLYSASIPEYEFYTSPPLGGSFGYNTISGKQKTGKHLRKYFLEFKNGDVIPFNDKIEISNSYPLIFTDRVELQRRIAEDSITNIFTLLKLYEESQQPTDSVIFRSEYNSNDFVDLYLFRNESLSDNDYQRHRIKIDNNLMGRIDQGEFLKIRTTRAKWFSLQIDSGNLESMYDIFGRTNHAIFLEIAIGNKIYVSPIEGSKALEYLGKHRKIEKTF